MSFRYRGSVSTLEVFRRLDLDVYTETLLKPTGRYYYWWRPALEGKEGDVTETEPQSFLRLSTCVKLKILRRRLLAKNKCRCVFFLYLSR